MLMLFILWFWFIYIYIYNEEGNYLIDIDWRTVSLFYNSMLNHRISFFLFIYLFFLDVLLMIILVCVRVCYIFMIQIVFFLIYKFNLCLITMWCFMRKDLFFFVFLSFFNFQQLKLLFKQEQQQKEHTCTYFIKIISNIYFVMSIDLLIQNLSHSSNVRIGFHIYLYMCLNIYVYILLYFMYCIMFCVFIIFMLLV